MVGLAIAIWVMALTLTDVADRMKLFRAPLKTALRRASGFPRAYWGGTFAHFGVGVAVLGMVGTSLWVTERQMVMAPGDEAEIAGLTLRFEDIKVGRVANYETEMSVFSLWKGNREVASLVPERRWYPVAQQQTIEAAIQPRWAHDVYVAIGEPRGENNEARMVRVYHHPLVLYLWMGGVLMVLGGILSLSDRRYRVGAPVKKENAKIAVPQPVRPPLSGAPAE